jgi:hypothetical protein
MKTLPIVLIAMTIAVQAQHAQVVADGATNTLSNLTCGFSPRASPAQTRLRRISDA